MYSKALPLFAKYVWRAYIKDYTMHTTAFDTRGIFCCWAIDKGNLERSLGQCLHTAVMVACARVDCLLCSTDRGCTNLRNLSCTVYLVYISSVDR